MPRAGSGARCVSTPPGAGAACKRCCRLRRTRPTSTPTTSAVGTQRPGERPSAGEPQQPTLRRHGPGRRARHRARRGPLPGLGAHHVPAADPSGRRQESQQAARLGRQPVFGVAVQDDEVPARLPDFPARFGCIEDARLHCQAFFAWYDNEHRHSGIGYITPQAVHFGHAMALREARQATLDAAFLASPRRFKGRRPQPASLPSAAWINPPPSKVNDQTTTQPCTVNS